jgi:hypothetical protein
LKLADAPVLAATVALRATPDWASKSVMLAVAWLLATPPLVVLKFSVVG